MILLLSLLFNSISKYFQERSNIILRTPNLFVMYVSVWLFSMTSIHFRTFQTEKFSGYDVVNALQSYIVIPSYSTPNDFHQEMTHQ